MDRVTIRVIIPKIDLTEAADLKLDIERILEDVEDVVVELTSITVRE